MEHERLEDQQDFSTKAVYDYTYALKRCYDTRAAWIVIFEDDILLADGWFVKTLQGISDIQRLFAASRNDWLFLRLFNQERSTGWASSIPGQNHETLISILIMIPTFLALLLLRHRSASLRRHLDNATLAIICLVAIPTFVVLFFQAGKASLLPPRPGVHKEAFGCCSQALVFPRDQIPRVRDYLTQRRSGQIDMMLDELAVQDSLDRYALYPVQAQHIGMLTSDSFACAGSCVYPLISCNEKAKGRFAVPLHGKLRRYGVWRLSNRIRRNYARCIVNW